MPNMTAILHVSFSKIAHFRLRPVNDRFHATDVQRNPEIPSYSFLASPASSPSPDTNGGIDLQVFGASNCLTLRLLRVD